MESALAPARPSVARDRLLAVASRLFYREGIKAVGVERILDEAQVTRATFYRHFAGKDALIEAYLERQDALVRAVFAESAARSTSPRHALELIIEGVADDAVQNHDRGCPFINAAAEYPDAQSPVRRIVAAHREWFRGTTAAALDAVGVDDVEGRTARFVLLRDAALVGCYLDGPASVRGAFVRSARQVFDLG